MISVGVVGLHVEGIFEPVKNRRLFLIDAQIEVQNPIVESLGC